MPVLDDARPGVSASDRRQTMVQSHLPLAHHLARRFNNRGESLDDLVQVATVGLIKAVDGFDDERGVEFASYAIPTILGELKRHFRDKGWCVQVPRRLKDLKLEVSKAEATLAQQLGRIPTAADLATYLDVPEADIRECALSARAYSPTSLSVPATGSQGSTPWADVLGRPDEALDSVENRATLRPLLRALPLRERKIIAMRFYGNMSQAQIAEQIGVSQMHVSRLLSRSLSFLRRGMLQEA